MPIYEYECKACGHEFELVQKISEPAVKKCPECGKNKVNKLISLTSFQLKGEGWYETDFKNPKPKKTTDSGSGDKKPKAKETKSADKSTSGTDKT
jgi:putative FmdB family regulatory protein